MKVLNCNTFFRHNKIIIIIDILIIPYFFDMTSIILLLFFLKIDRRRSRVLLKKNHSYLLDLVEAKLCHVRCAFQEVKWRDVECFEVFLSISAFDMLQVVF